MPFQFNTIHENINCSEIFQIYSIYLYNMAPYLHHVIKPKIRFITPILTCKRVSPVLPSEVYILFQLFSDPLHHMRVNQKVLNLTKKISVLLFIMLNYFDI